MNGKIMTAAEAVAMIEDGQTLLIGGSGGGVTEATGLLRALSDRFEKEGGPRDLTLVHTTGPESTLVKNYTFAGTNLWVDVGGTNNVAASLLPAAQRGTLGGAGTVTFAPAVDGWVDIESPQAGLPLRLEVDPGAGKTVAELVAFMAPSGLDPEQAGPGTIAVAFPSADAPQHFIWDLSGFAPDATIGGLANRAEGSVFSVR